jgi:hypothetical protein
MGACKAPDKRDRQDVEMDQQDETVVELPALGDVWKSRDGSVTLLYKPGGPGVMRVKVGNLTVQAPLERAELRDLEAAIPLFADWPRP